jgi:hypothetical protein
LLDARLGARRLIEKQARTGECALILAGRILRLANMRYRRVPICVDVYICKRVGE